MPKLSAGTHIALGQTFLLVSLFMAAILLGLVPDRLNAIREGRAALAEAIAIHSSDLIAQGRLHALEDGLKLVLERNQQLESAAVRRSDGVVLVGVGDHQLRWLEGAGPASSDTQISVPIWSGARKWGRIELRFSPLTRAGWVGVLQTPRAKLVIFIALAGFFVFYFYLRKMLQHLDPSQAVPPHVRSALDTLAEGLLVMDLKQRIVLANEAFAQMVGQKSEALMGRRAAQLDWLDSQGERVDELDYPWARALEYCAPQRNDMIHLCDHEGEMRTFLVNCSPVLVSGGSYGGVLVSLDDVTQLEEHKTQLSIAKEEAESANQAKSDFLANMSHEIRTPMNAILGFTEVLRRGYGKSEEERRRHLETIHSSGEHLLQLINDVLDLSKIESGRLEVERIRFAPHTLLQEVVRALGVKAEEKGLSLELEVSGPVPETLLSDPTRLRQIVTNLVSNAVKFTESGGVEIRAGMVEEAQGSCFAIEVKDTGIGIEPAALDSIFEAFVQADTSVTRRFGGTGLGLDISRRFARMLGGDIVVSSTPGEGSTFYVTLDAGPLDGVRQLSRDEVLAAVVDATAEGAPGWSFPSSRVLVVDDGDENRELVQLLLEEVGITVETAENGRVGVDMATANEYDAILMDVQMPVMDGYAATSHLRELGCEVPILALTAHAMKGFERACKDAGFTGYLTKPIDIDRLMETLAGVLGGERLAEGQRTLGRRRPQAAIVGGSGVRSRLEGNPRLHSAIETFVGRLVEKREAMEAAWESRDYEELAGIAHWLKGAAGTVGFDEFTEPAENLEQLVKERKEGEIEAALDVVRDLAECIELPGAERREAPYGSTPSRGNGAVAPAKSKAVATDGPVNSRLASNPRLHATLDRFVGRLDTKLGEIRASWESRDWQELADLAHWLKGAAGTVGYDAFTEPAERLELLARAESAGTEAEIEETIAILASLGERILAPGSAP